MMNTLSENTCYLTVIRPSHKSVQHCTTGTCEVERVSYQNNHEHLQYSIKHSKMLDAYKRKYPYTKPFNHDQIDQISLHKNIGDKKAKFYIGKTLKQLHCSKYALYFIEKTKSTRYDSSNPEHQRKLLSIWKKLKPEQKLSNRISDQWISIGFQANDPATDFRGAGILGLQNLYTFVSNPKCIKIFKIASDPETQYFFSSASLFFTMLASQLMKQKKISADYWVHENDQQLFNKFQAIYQMLFLQFSDFWVQKCPNKSVMYFNQNLKQFERQVKSLSLKQIKGRINDYQN